MQERASELKADARRCGRAVTADHEADVLARIAEMPEPDRSMAERIHAIVKESARSSPRRPGMACRRTPKDGKVVCFFQSAAKFNARYATFGFNDPPRSTTGPRSTDGATLDDGAMWPTSFALTRLGAAEEAAIAALLAKSIR